MTGLKEARLKRNISQSQLAKKVGVSQTVISMLETYDIYPGETLSAAIDEALGKEKKGEQMTQNQRVLQYMRDNGRISQRDAVKFGCYRLSARIHNLRSMGYHIVMEEKPFKSEYGSGWYAEYKLVGEALT